MNVHQAQNDRLRTAIEMAYGTCTAIGPYLEWSVERTTESVIVVLNVVFTPGKFVEGSDMKRGYRSPPLSAQDQKDPEAALNYAENMILFKMHRDAIRFAAKNIAETAERFRRKPAIQSANGAEPA